MGLTADSQAGADEEVLLVEKVEREERLREVQRGMRTPC